MKRVIAYFLCVILVLYIAVSASAASKTPASSANPDPFGKLPTLTTVTAVLNYSPAGDPKTLKGVTPETQSFVKMAKNLLNINIKFLWQAPSDQYSTKFGVALASNDLPDVMSVNSQQFELLKQNGQLADWSGAYKYFSPDMKKFIERDPAAINYGKSNGKMYGIPQYWDTRRDVQLMFIRQDWLNELGLKMPKTTVDLKNVMTAFVQKKHAVSGMAMCKIFDGWGFDIKQYTTLFNAYPKRWIAGSNGSLVAGEVQPEAKVALQNLADWYKSGLIDKEFATQNEDKMGQELIAGQIGVVVGPWWMYEWPLNNSKDQDPKANWAVADLPSFNGAPVQTVLNRFTIDGTNSYKVINKNCKNPEAVVKLFNLYMDACSNTSKYGNQALPQGGFVWSWCPTQYNDPYDINTTFENLQTAIKANNNGAGLKPGDKGMYDKYTAYENFVAGKQKWDGSVMGNAMSRIMIGGGWDTSRKVVSGPDKKIYNEFYGNPTPSMVSKGPTLDTLTAETYTKIIMGAAPVSSFDNYVKQWKQLGGDSITKEVNDWYKTHKK